MHAQSYDLFQNKIDPGISVSDSSPLYVVATGLRTIQFLIAICFGFHKVGGPSSIGSG
jgi:hypothetical protein